jgi:hypothetical protein
MSGAKILKFSQSPKSCLDYAKDMEEKSGFDAVIVLGIPTENSEIMLLSVSEGLSDAETVYILECAKAATVLPAVFNVYSDEEE